MNSSFLYLALGSLIMLVGFAAGFFACAKAITWAGRIEYSRQTGRPLTRDTPLKPPTTSGPVKPMTPEDYKIEADRPMREKLAAILQPRKP